MGGKRFMLVERKRINNLKTYLSAQMTSVVVWGLSHLLPLTCRVVALCDMALGMMMQRAWVESVDGGGRWVTRDLC